MSVILRRSSSVHGISSNCRCYTARALQSLTNDYTSEPVYPPIQDLSFKAKLRRKRESWHDHIKSLKTVEEKLMAINMPRYYGYKAVVLTDDKVPYNVLPLTQHYTRTEFKQVETLPEYYKKNDGKVDTFLKAIKSDIEDAIQFEYDGYKQLYTYKDEPISPDAKEQILTSAIVTQINRALTIGLGADCRHLNDGVIDIDPRHEAFWFVGGVQPTELVRKIKKGSSCEKDFSDEPLDRQVQYKGSPYLALRHDYPLQAIVDYDSNEIKNTTAVPKVKYDPRTFGYSTDYLHGATIPGFWPGSPQEFGLLSYQRRSHMTIRNPSYGAADMQEALHSQGILSSFAWLFGQACYQGFSTFNDITYPLVSQTIITNGQLWSFYVYQMNTVTNHQVVFEENEKSNLCWGTKEQRLFEEINDKGQLVGFNEDVLKSLVHFYINEPKQRNIEMRPYLGVDEQRVADIEHDKRREFLENKYKHLASHRPRHLLVPEMYNWEKIYKVDHKTRPMEAKRRFFELDINPWRKRLDDHIPEYIPKVLRPGGPKSKPKHEKTYYP